MVLRDPVLYCHFACRVLESFGGGCDAHHEFLLPLCGQGGAVEPQRMYEIVESTGQRCRGLHRYGWGPPHLGPVGDGLRDAAGVPQGRKFGLVHDLRNYSPPGRREPGLSSLTIVILSDISIKKALADGRIVIDPLDERAIQPSSVDLRIDHYFRVFRNHTTPFIDPKLNQEDLTELVTVEGDTPFILHPGEFVLASTLERVAVGDDLVGRLEGKSSLGRLGLLIHTTAGFVDSGFDGYLTLELSNVANLPMALYPEMKIGQISFLQMTTPAEIPYGGNATGSKYQGQRGPTPSRYYLNFDRP